jgi:hypothetical protein
LSLVIEGAWKSSSRNPKLFSTYIHIVREKFWTFQQQKHDFDIPLPPITWQSETSFLCSSG